MAGRSLPHQHGEGEEMQALQSVLENEEGFRTMAELFAKLGDPTRIRLFWLLCHCEECVINLSAMMGMSSPALSHHLRLLSLGGLVQSRRAGKEVYYRAADTREALLLHRMIEQVMTIACPEMVPPLTFGGSEAVGAGNIRE